MVTYKVYVHDAGTPPPTVFSVGSCVCHMLLYPGKQVLVLRCKLKHVLALRLEGLNCSTSLFLLQLGFFYGREYKDLPLSEIVALLSRLRAKKYTTLALITYRNPVVYTDCAVFFLSFFS